MNKVANLTDKEFKVLSSVYRVAGNGQEITNKDALEYLLCDNYSWFEAKDVIRDVGMKREAVAALLGSLEKKGLLFLDADPGSCGPDSYITEECHKMILALLA